MIKRIILALNRPTIQRQLKKRLVSPEVIVDLQRDKRQLWERLKREVCDLVVVSWSSIPKPSVESISLINEMPDGPSLVVILENDEPELRAQLLAAGCHAVLDTEVSIEGLCDVLETVLAQREEIAQQRLTSQSPFTQPQLRDFVSNSPIMQAFLEVVERVVHSNCSLLILGETGVGKERLARAVHNESSRSKGPFIAINCGALPESLLESELFGHEEGAFTGATRSRRGCFELAHAGTLFLDEIGDLPNHLQVKLLRVLQEREIRRLGGERAISIEVRIMAATNRNLDLAVEQNEFRRDLYYRLNVMMLTLPPLRERSEDIFELAQNYVDYLRPRIACEVYSISKDALNALRRYQWPGNVRELINVIERAMLLCVSDQITLKELPVTISACKESALSSAALLSSTTLERMPDEWLSLPWREVRKEVLSQAERLYLAGLLEQTGGKIGKTAELAGMHPRSLFEKMRRLGLRKEFFRINN